MHCHPPVRLCWVGSWADLGLQQQEGDHTPSPHHEGSDTRTLQKGPPALSPGRWEEGSKSWHPQSLDPGGTPAPRAVESSAPAGLRFSSTAPESRGRRGPGTFGGARRLLRVGGAGRAQWAVRGALRTAAPSAGPRCTVSVKLHQLTGHRNLITQPCPFPTPLGPGETPAR